jgi:hypothetical protein
MLGVSTNVRQVPLTDIRHESRNPTRLTRIRLAADAGDVVDLGEHSRGGNRTLDRMPIHYAIPECSQRRGIYLRGSSVGRLATTPRAPSVFST